VVDVGKYEFDYMGECMSGKWVDMKRFAMVSMVGSDSELEWDSEYTHWFVFYQCIEGADDSFEVGAVPVNMDGTSEMDTAYIQWSYDNERESMLQYREYLRDAASGVLMGIE
jgi:hypothetical protein